MGIRGVFRDINFLQSASFQNHEDCLPATQASGVIDGALSFRLLSGGVIPTSTLINIFMSINNAYKYEYNSN